MSHIQKTSGFETCFHTSIRNKYLESCSVGAMSLPYLPKFISVLMRQVYSSCLVTQNSVWCGTVPCFFPSAINHQDFCSNLQQLLCGEFPFTTEDTTVKNPILKVQVVKSALTTCTLRPMGQNVPSPSSWTRKAESLNRRLVSDSDSVSMFKGQPDSDSESQL